LNRANDENSLKKHCYWSWDMGLWIRCWNKSSIITIGVKRVTMTKKKWDKCGQTLKSCWQFFLFWGHCSPWISSTRQDSDQEILSSNNETSSWGYQKKRHNAWR
jgi:hypothetical protein